jgi:flagellar hook assembly protein FlgD
MNPTSNQDLLQQMNAIGQLQSSNTLQTSLQSMVLQNQIGSAGNLIGKSVKGTNDQDKDVSGIVNSVRIESNQVYLELDNGSKLQLGRVTSIAASTAAASATQAGAKVAA